MGVASKGRIKGSKCGSAPHQFPASETGEPRFGLVLVSVCYDHTVTLSHKSLACMHVINLSICSLVAVQVPVLLYSQVWGSASEETPEVSQWNIRAEWQLFGSKICQNDR